MEDVPELFPSFLVLFSFLFLSSPEKRYPSLCSKPMLHPYSSFCLQPFSNYSMAAVDFDYCPAGAVKPVGASSISSYSEPTAEPFFAPHPPPHTDNPQQCWGSHTWHGGAMAAMQGTVGVSSNILVLIDQEKPRSPVTSSMKPSHSPPVSSVIIIVYPYSKYRLWHSFYTYHMLYSFFVNFFCYYSLYATKL